MHSKWKQFTNDLNGWLWRPLSNHFSKLYTQLQDQHNYTVGVKSGSLHKPISNQFKVLCETMQDYWLTRTLKNSSNTFLLFRWQIPTILGNKTQHVNQYTAIHSCKRMHTYAHIYTHTTHTHRHTLTVSSPQFSEWIVGNGSGKWVSGKNVKFCWL